MNTLFKAIRETMAHLLRLDDAADEQLVIEGIEKSVEFRGAKLWVLVLAVFVASLGLNTNSAAVIIGAMLISPLMGPIIGMGLGLGIYDFDMLRRSWRNYTVATLFSITTATLYFLATPIAEAQSELLARTSPTIYDVLIALCGGLAGIIALSSSSQRTGNVIPGVAIATALMPPLCTVGFGIATANWSYAAGALYLFLINTIFIVFATLVGVVFIMQFKKRKFIDPAREKHVKRLIYLIVLVTIIPSIVLTFGMVRKNTFEQRVKYFIQHELRFDNTQVVSYHTNYEARTFDVILIGNEIDTLTLSTISSRLSDYKLDGISMNVVQGSDGMTTDDLQRMIIADKDASRNNEAIIAQQNLHIHDLEQQLKPYTETSTLSATALREMQILCPQVKSIYLAHGTFADADTTHTQSAAIITLDSRLKDQETTDRLTHWLRQRTGIADLRIITQVETGNK